MLGRKIAGKEQQQESSKKQRMEDDKEIDEVEEVEEVDEAELKKHLLLKEGIMVHYQLIRPTGSSKEIYHFQCLGMLQGIDRDDLQALWKLVRQACLYPFAACSLLAVVKSTAVVFFNNQQAQTEQ
ncbi:hypothetical protein Tco_0132830 [Tanacetum coccineum]